MFGLTATTTTITKKKNKTANVGDSHSQSQTILHAVFKVYPYTLIFWEELKLLDQNYHICLVNQDYCSVKVMSGNISSNNEQNCINDKQKATLQPHVYCKV